MARPTTKTDLISAANDKYQKMMELIASLSPEQQEGTFAFDTTKDKEAHWQRDQNLRDVLIHLYEWHQLLLNWVTSNTKGEAKHFLKEGYNWRTYPDMNRAFWEQHQETPFAEALASVEKSHAEVITLAEKFSNDELFAKGSFPWVGGSTLGSYFVSTMASHYDWAIKKIKRFKKSLA